jgi:hypothetical protein
VRVPLTARSTSSSTHSPGIYATRSPTSCTLPPSLSFLLSMVHGVLEGWIGALFGVLALLILSRSSIVSGFIVENVRHALQHNRHKSRNCRSVAGRQFVSTEVFCCLYSYSYFILFQWIDMETNKLYSLVWLSSRLILRYKQAILWILRTIYTLIPVTKEGMSQLKHEKIPHLL